MLFIVVLAIGVLLEDRLSCLVDFIEEKTNR